MSGSRSSCISISSGIVSCSSGSSHSGNSGSTTVFPVKSPSSFFAPFIVPFADSAVLCRALTTYGHFLIVVIPLPSGEYVAYNKNIYIGNVNVVLERKTF